MPDLFDMKLRAMRRDRAARQGPELFLHERAFDDCVERVALMNRSFARALILGCPDPDWTARLHPLARKVDGRDPGSLFATAAGGSPIVEDAWEPPPQTYDLVVAVGTLDTLNDLQLALQLIRYAMRPDALLIGAVSGGDTLPKLRAAMRAADALSGAAAPHVHPRIDASALAGLLTDAGFQGPVVDVDRTDVSYRSLARLVADLRRMGATSVLKARSPSLTREQRISAETAFAGLGEGGRTVERFEILHFAAWTPSKG